MPDPGASRRWYRARVTRDSGCGPVEVGLLDVGGRQVVERREVVALPPHLGRRGEFGMVCSLGVGSGWREPGRLQQLVVGSVVEVRKVRTDGRTDAKYKWKLPNGLTESCTNYTNGQYAVS